MGRRIVHPERWVGRYVGKVRWEQFQDRFSLCDECGRFFPRADLRESDLPEVILWSVLGIIKGEFRFCPECLRRLRVMALQDLIDGIPLLRPLEGMKCETLSKGKSDRRVIRRRREQKP